MRVLVQRVSRASVSISGQIESQIEQGLVVLVGVAENDDRSCADWLATKTSKLRVFDDEQGRMNLSVKDIDGQVLCISQFTLLGELNKGSRPNYALAAHASAAETLYESYVDCLKRSGVEVRTGIFGAKMSVELVNDGPVTVMLERQ